MMLEKHNLCFFPSFLVRPWISSYRSIHPLPHPVLYGCPGNTGLSHCFAMCDCLLPSTSQFLPCLCNMLKPVVANGYFLFSRGLLVCGVICRHICFLNGFIFIMMTTIMIPSTAGGTHFAACLPYIREHRYRRPFSGAGSCR